MSFLISLILFKLVKSWEGMETNKCQLSSVVLPRVAWGCGTSCCATLGFELPASVDAMGVKLLMIATTVLYQDP